MPRILHSPDVQTGIALSMLSGHVASVGVVLVLFAQDLGMRVSSLSWMGSAFGVGLILAALAGPFLLRLGAQRVLAGASLGIAIGMTLVATVYTLPLAALGIAVVSLAGAATVLAVSAILSGANAEARLTRVNAGASAVAVVAPLAIGALVSAGLNGRLALLAAVPLLVMASVAAWRTPDPAPPEVSIPPAPDDAASSPLPQPSDAVLATPGRGAEVDQSTPVAAPSPGRGTEVDQSTPLTDPNPGPTAAIGGDRGGDVVGRFLEDHETGPGRAGAAWRPSKRAVLRRWLAQVMSVAAEFSFLVWGVSRLIDAGLEAGPAATLGAVFPLGMAAGRIVGPWMMARVPAVPVGAGLGAVGTVLVVVGPGWPVIAAGLLVAGFGIATLYPVTLAHLMATPGLPQSWGPSLGALASGAAVMVAPAVLALVGEVVELRLAFLLVLPILGALVLLYGRPAADPVG
ncbi:MAG: MFS transporter [Actinobacteria bacterium]|nr:MFS transporter [Actinomycetota bacterium]